MSKPSTKWTPEARAAEPPSAEALRGRALALLTRREHSRAELKAKLLEQGGTVEQVESLLNELGTATLQDDRRFAEAFVRSRRLRGQGPVAIRQELGRRGVTAEVVEAVLDHEVDWLAEASAVRRKRFGPARPGDRREQARQMRFLQYRGFPTAVALAVLRQAGADEDDLLS